MAYLSAILVERLRFRSSASVLTAQSGVLPNRRCSDMPTRRWREVFTGSESYLHASSRLVQCKSVRARCGPCGELVHTPCVAHSKMVHIVHNLLGPTLVGRGVRRRISQLGSCLHTPGADQSSVKHSVFNAFLLSHDSSNQLHHSCSAIVDSSPGADQSSVKHSVFNAFLRLARRRRIYTNLCCC